MHSKLIVLHPADNVATALDDIQPGEIVQTRDHKVTAAQAVPFGHKIALRGIARGAVITKYGESIGCAAADIAEGQLVHVHNVESQRGRGDLTAQKE
jgi:altronate dehydratase small subunit